MTKQRRSQIRIDAYDAVGHLVDATHLASRQFATAKRLKVGGKARQKAMAKYKVLTANRTRLVSKIRFALGILGQTS